MLCTRPAIMVCIWYVVYQASHYGLHLVCSVGIVRSRTKAMELCCVPGQPLWSAFGMLCTRPAIMVCVFSHCLQGTYLLVPFIIYISLFLPHPF